ncbi:MAG: co-chaperone DjlA [Pseudomonadota bacterium]
MTCRIIATILGFFFGGPMGAIIGFFIGSFLDQSVNKTQSNGNGPRQNFFNGHWSWKQTLNQPFVRGTFILMGYLAKADGQVTPNEIRIASNVMTQLRLPDDQRHLAMRWFYDGKNQQFDPEEVFQKLRLYRQTPLIRVLLTCLTTIAYANGMPSATQRQVLKEICAKLGIENPEAQQQYSHSQYNYSGNHHDAGPKKNSLSDNYQLMGLKPDADVATIRKTYRRLMNKYHPDKLSAKGASEKEIKAANEKIYQIRSAYESVMRSKGENV